MDCAGGLDDSGYISQEKSLPRDRLPRPTNRNLVAMMNANLFRQIL
jgi:hypothetical protein